MQKRKEYIYIYNKKNQKIQNLEVIETIQKIYDYSKEKYKKKKKGT